MKKNFILAAAICVFVMAVSVSAQKATTTDFSGKWALDVAKSKLGERNNIESQTMTVTQTAADIKIETATKRMAPPAGAPAGGRMGGGGGGDTPMTYSLGKETRVDQQMGQVTVPVTMKSSWDGSKLILATSRTFTRPGGDVTSTTKDTWELGADGKTLTVTAERTGPQGSTSTTRVYSKG